MSDPASSPDQPSTRPKITLAGGRFSNASGLITVAIIAASFILSAILIPVAAHLPRWIEFEIVLAVWWAIWLVVAVVLLFKGIGVDDDVSRPHLPSGSQFGCVGDPGCSGCGALPFDGGCGEVFGWIFLVLLAGIALWFLVEFLLPALAFAIYWAIVRLLARIVNDRHDCKGSLARAVFWGFVWATVYTLPLITIVWGFHFIHRPA
jgi:hypothetical protein